MGSVWFDGVEDLNTLAVDLGRAGQVVGEMASAVVRKTLLQIEGDAKSFAPVDTGNLRNSIGVDLDQDGLGGGVGPSASYGAFVEFGTARTGPQAYMGPALDRHSGEFEDALLRLAEDIL